MGTVALVVKMTLKVCRLLSSLYTAAVDDEALSFSDQDAVWRDPLLADTIQAYDQDAVWRDPLLADTIQAYPASLLYSPPSELRPEPHCLRDAIEHQPPAAHVLRGYAPPITMF
jgi:hypothetical protein